MSPMLLDTTPCTCTPTTTCPTCSYLTSLETRHHRLNRSVRA